VNGAGPVVASAGITATGIVSVGPYTVGDVVTLSVTHNQVSACDINITGSFSSCCGGDCTSAQLAVLGTNVTPAIDCGGGASNAGAGGATNAQWFEYTATATGVLTVSSCLPNNAAAVDTRVSLHNGTCGALNFLIEDDDGCGATTPGSFSSTAGAFVTMGDVIYIEWDDRWSGDSFDWDLSFAPCTPPATDICSMQMDSTVMLGDSIAYNLDAFCSSDDAGIAGLFGGVAGTSWITFTLTSCSDVTVDFCGTGVFTNASLNLYGDCGAVQQINSQSFDFTTCADGNPTIFYNSLPPGQYYYPVLFGTAFASNVYTLHVAANTPVLGCAPDVCTLADPVTCGSFVTGTTVSNQATQGPNVCIPNHTAPGADAWYVFAGTGDLVTASTCFGTTYNSMLTIYIRRL